MEEVMEMTEQMATAVVRVVRGRGVGHAKNKEMSFVVPPGQLTTELMKARAKAFLVWVPQALRNNNINNSNGNGRVKGFDITTTSFSRGNGRGRGKDTFCHLVNTGSSYPLMRMWQRMQNPRGDSHGHR